MKVHKDHFDKDEEFIGYCKVNFDIKEMLLLATTPDEQKKWVRRLQYKVSKEGYAQSNTGDKALGYVSRGPPQKRHSMATLSEEQVSVRRSSVSDFRPSRHNLANSMPSYMFKGHSPPQSQHQQHQQSHHWLVTMQCCELPYGAESGP